ncbi:MAG: SIMPL domain-containing protein [Clostridium sp.]|jgi:uncharacterized protein YggE|uniref:SIMPL domain-containing protein n=1 Tax=Clostridium sp. TaxID=1506 RepID=UPI0025BC8DA4|nr:SIMPL domain-containing protein [Clostridium sp.]MCH3964466.1 SIMPL domain-containing protein [Clostridium sp.]MCI1715640.1 SIMPL domain-containing protein [Clostridium sp.]MCI1799567.1 SIMPL domain-containing protein [Clostridium sp.]MCI1813824.1 SIMPL domain-containing protein [Clostridium sp.]MCI1870379.1 SIMPL domain-containing protein [Clostridium sp.]
MDHLIRVKGTSNINVKPDLIVIAMNLESQHYDYGKTMKLAADSIEILQNAIESASFDKEDLKTTSFNIKMHYESCRDNNDNYRSKFDGYICKQSLKIEFDFDTEVMSKVFAAIAKTQINPQLDIQFSVKDKSAISEKLLVSAAENAKHKAEVLAKASGVTLGDLIGIDYDWGELHLYSQTKYEVEENCMTVQSSYAPDIEPDNIEVSDTVLFSWKIK